MPYKSDAQRRFFHAAEARGDIPASTVEEFDKASKGHKLPEKKGATMNGKKDGDAYGDMTLPSTERDERIMTDTGKHKNHGRPGSHEDTEKKRRED